MITVFTLPRCVQCDAVKRFLDQKNVHYNAIDLRTDPVAMGKVEEWGFKGAPVVAREGHEPFNGFDLDRLQAMIA